jgi:hypothetical protein
MDGMLTAWTPSHRPYLSIARHNHKYDPLTQEEIRPSYLNNDHGRASLHA